MGAAAQPGGFDAGCHRLRVTGSKVVDYPPGIALMTSAVVLLGAWVEAGQRGAAELPNTAVHRIPLLDTVYTLVHCMVGLFHQRGADGRRAMSPVWLLHFGSPAGAGVPGRLSSPAGGGRRGPALPGRAGAHRHGDSADAVRPDRRDL